MKRNESDYLKRQNGVWQDDRQLRIDRIFLWRLSLFTSFHLLLLFRLPLGSLLSSVPLISFAEQLFCICALCYFRERGPLLLALLLAARLNSIRYQSRLPRRTVGISWLNSRVKWKVIASPANGQVIGTGKNQTMTVNPRSLRNAFVYAGPFYLRKRMMWLLHKK